MAEGLLRRARTGDVATITGPCELHVEKHKGRIYYRLVGDASTEFRWSVAAARENRRRGFPVDDEEVQPPEVLE